MIVMPTGSANVCGRMFGNGTYLSDISTKALNYGYGYWGNGKREKNCFMFMVDTAMGKYYVPRHSDCNLRPPPGYDSVWAKPGESGIQNNEMIVYRTSQFNLKFLVEFSN
jgi:poly [ADP-ribose] polymerase